MKVFIFDRDGVINVDSTFVHKIKDFLFKNGIFEIISYLISKDHKLFIATNQSGIDRGLYTKKDFKKVTNYMLEEFRKKGIDIEKIFYCPHKPEDNCDCRKPKIGMVKDYFSNKKINKNSFMIGDKDADTLFGKRLGLKTIRMKSDYKEEIKADYRIKNLNEVKKII